MRLKTNLRFLMILSCAFFGSVQATETLRLATAAPAKSIWQQQTDQFIKDVDTETNGRVKIEAFYNAQLGSEQAVLPQLRRGRVDMAMMSISALADQLSEAYLVSMLFYYDNLSQRSCILDNIKNDYRELISPLGLHLLDWTETGSGQLSGTKAYLTPDTIRGQRIGVAANPISNKFWEEKKSLPVPTPSTEAASNLATGLIDVYPTIPVFYVFGGINKVAPVLTKLDYVISPATILINQKIWDKLSKSDREGVERALAKQPSAERSKAFYAFEASVLEMHKKAGGTVVVATPEQKAQWKTGLENYYKNTLKNASPQGQKFFSKLESAKKTCSQ